MEECARVIFAGGTVIFPNDTSYGIACDPYRSEAIDRIYGAKGRPDNKPLTMHVATAAEFLEFARENPLAILASKRLLPCPITLIVRKPNFVSDELTAGMPTLGFRVPDEPLAKAILERCGPLAVSSANPSGAEPYRGDGANANLPPADLLIEHGPTRYALESSIMDLTVSPPRLLREGAVSFERLTELLGPIERRTVKVRSQP
ncbi:MAG TPA: L-threonylcarbamoyladenylate synthase [Candidatus Baltobacteraceae bacterium]|nr:L-threonylcarbamoyladenylate synthase [Candidatus Baltobacteraceae bacterium]